MKKLAKCLDPNAQVRINFKDFCHGVLAIKGRTERHAQAAYHRQLHNSVLLVCVYVSACVCVVHTCIWCLPTEAEEHHSATLFCHYPPTQVIDAGTEEAG